MVSASAAAPADGRDRKRDCLFCGSTEKLTGEHVLPMWLQRHLGIPPTLRYESVVVNQESGDVEAYRPLPLGDFRDKRVCERCNNGWMSQLEERAKPLLVALLDGERSLDELTLEEQETLGAWAVKTAFMTSSSSGLGMVPIEHFRAASPRCVMLPRGLMVLAAETEHRPPSKIAYTNHSAWVNHNDENTADLVKTSYKVVLQLGRLVLVVAFWPGGDHWAAFLINDFHHALWPPYHDDWWVHATVDDLPMITSSREAVTMHGLYVLVRERRRLPNNGMGARVRLRDAIDLRQVLDRVEDPERSGALDKMREARGVKPHSESEELGSSPQHDD